MCRYWGLIMNTSYVTTSTAQEIMSPTRDANTVSNFLWVWGGWTVFFELQRVITESPNWKTPGYLNTHHDFALTYLNYDVSYIKFPSDILIILKHWKITFLHPTLSVGCNCLSLPLILVSGTTFLSYGYHETKPPTPLYVGPWDHTYTNAHEHVHICI